MIKRCFLILIIGVLALCCYGCQIQQESENEKPAMIANGTAQGNYKDVSYKEIARNESFLLELCENSTLFRITDLRNGRIYTSAMEEQTANGANLSVSYIDKTGVTRTLNSFTDAVKNGQFLIDKFNDGFRIQYSIGSVESILYGPKIISGERYLRFFDACDTAGQRLMSQIYRSVDIANMAEDASATALQNYPQA